jgi:hypothetical protein
MSKRAITHLSSDPVMSGLIEKVGPIRLRPRRHSPFQSLTQAIIHQQLSGKAAGTILERFIMLFPDDEFPAPSQVAKSSVDRLRTAGLSRPKAAYIIDLAKRCNAGLIPSVSDCDPLNDEDIIATLTEIKGITLDRGNVSHFQSRPPGCPACPRSRRPKGLSNRLPKAQFADPGTIGKTRSPMGSSSHSCRTLPVAGGRFSR